MGNSISFRLNPKCASDRKILAWLEEKSSQPGYMNQTELIKQALITAMVQEEKGVKEKEATQWMDEAIHKAAEEFAKGAEDRGVSVIIAAAGKAAHLGGVIAAYTTLPVIALPIKSSLMDGLDSLLSMVQMPSGIPVATVAVNGADNAGILAVQMLALSDKSLTDKLKQFKSDMAKAVEEKDKALQEELGLIKKA